MPAKKKSTKPKAKPKRVVVPASLRHNLQKKNGNKGRTVTTQREDFFCYLLKAGAGMSATAAAQRAGLNPRTTTHLLYQKRIQDRIQEIDGALFEEMRKQLDQTYMLELSFLDENLAELIAEDRVHKYRGYEHRFKAIEIGYKRMKAGAYDHAPSAVTQNNLINGNVVKGTMAEVYKSKWLRDKEQKLREQLEAGDGKTITPGA